MKRWPGGLAKSRLSEFTLVMKGDVTPTQRKKNLRNLCRFPLILSNYCHISDCTDVLYPVPDAFKPQADVATTFSDTLRQKSLQRNSSHPTVPRSPCRFLTCAIRVVALPHHVRLDEMIRPGRLTFLDKWNNWS